MVSVYMRADAAKDAIRTRPAGSESVSRYTSCAPRVTLLEVQLSTMLLLVAVAPSEIVPVDAAELELALELDGLLDDTTEELEDLLEDTTELEDATELDGLLDEELAIELLVPPQAEAVRVAPFLPTPAYWSSLSFTHCGLTGE